MIDGVTKMLGLTLKRFQMFCLHETGGGFDITIDPIEEDIVLNAPLEHVDLYLATQDQ